MTAQEKEKECVWGLFFNNNCLYGIYKTKELAASVLNKDNCDKLYMQELIVNQYEK